MPTAIELLKSYGLNTLGQSPEDLISQWVHEKNFSAESVIETATSGLLGLMTQRYVIGQNADNPDETRHVLNYLLRRSVKFKGFVSGEEYRGTRAQNKAIDKATSQNKDLDIGLYGKVGIGSMTRFILPSSNVSGFLPTNIRQTKIAVIGYGAAGILLTYALRNIGFAQVQIYEKSKPLGIWNREAVYSRSRNNPAALRFGDSNLDAAPGSGTSVKAFLENLTYGISPQTIESMTPNSLKHTLVVNKVENTYPIVINCGGLGSPREVNDAKRMKTKASATACGERWQRVITQDEAKNKMFCFVGLGNSTAEMLRQIHTLQDQGVDCDYRVLTHYPETAVQDPETTVIYGNRTYRVFRDLSQPNLTSFQGDLTDSRYDYYRALRGYKIITNVTEWNPVKDGDTTIVRYIQNKSGFQSDHFVADKLFTLIGYQPTVKTFNSFGIDFDAEDKCSMLDYDGEVQTRTGQTRTGDRLHKGYYVFGAMATNPLAKNNIVIPGMLFRLNDLTPSIILRAYEAQAVK